VTFHRQAFKLINAGVCSKQLYLNLCNPAVLFSRWTIGPAGPLLIRSNSFSTDWNAKYKGHNYLDHTHTHTLCSISRVNTFCQWDSKVLQRCVCLQI